MDFVALEMIRELQKLDHENEYVIFINEGPDQCLQETENFKIVTFGGSYPVWEQIKLPRAAKAYGCDVLHCTSNTAPVNCPVPLILTIHDIIYFETHPLMARGYSWYQRMGNLYRRIVVRKNLQKADVIITVSHYERKRFEDSLDLPDEKLRVIYNGVGNHFKPEMREEVIREIRDRYDLPEKYFLFLGNTDPKKNTANTIRAFAHFCKEAREEYYLVVVDLDRNVIKRLLAEEGLSEYQERIHFTGYIRNTDLPIVLQLAKVFLYPSKRESFGIPILEAMASGTAVITSNVASMPEVAGGAALLVNPFDPGNIKDAMLQIVTDEHLRTELIKKGFARAPQFSWENTAIAVSEIYKRFSKTGSHV